MGIRKIHVHSDSQLVTSQPELEILEQPAPYEPEPYNIWRIPIIDYIERGITPPDKWETRKLKAQSARYCIMEGRLMKNAASKVPTWCVPTGHKQKTSRKACTKDNVVATAVDVPSPSESKSKATCGQPC